MIVAAVIWTVVTLDLAALHLLWAARIWVPLGEEAALARAVVGTRDVTRMPSPLACAAIALILVFGALLPWWDPLGLRGAAMMGFAVVLGLRGVAAFLPVWARRTPEHPFRALDRAAYGPLCLALGALAATLAI